MVGPTQRPVEEIHTAQEELRQAVAPVTRAMTAVPQTNPTRDAAAAEEAVLLSGRRLIAHLPLNPQMVERIIRGMLDTNQQQEYSQEITALTNLAAQANTPQAQRALRNAVEQLPELLQTIDRLREMGVTDGVTSLRNSFRRSLNTREPNEQIFNSAMQFCQSVLANREMINQDPQMIREIGEIFRRSNNPNLTNEFITDGFSQSTNRLQERIQNATAMLAERAERVAGRCDDLMESAQDTNLVRALSEMRDRANAIQNSLTGGRPISAETIQTIQSMERVAETTADIIQGRRVENRQVLSLCARAISLSNSQKEYGAEFCILMARAVVTGQIRADRSTMAEIENENPNYPALMRRILATLPTTNPEMAGAIARILNGMQDMQTPVRFFGLIEMTQRIRNDAPTIPRNFTAEQRNQYQQIVSRVIGIFAAANLDLSKAMEIYEVSREFLRTGQNEQRALIRAVEQGSESIQNVILLIRGRRQLGQILGNRTQCGEFFNSYRELNNQIERMISRYAAGEMVGQGAIENIRIVYALFFGNQNEIGQSVINPQRNNGTGAIYANYQTRLRNINDSISGLRGSQRTTAMRNYARAIEMVFAQGIDASTGALLLAQAYATNTRDREEIQNAINNQALNPQIQMDIGLAYINRGTSIPAIRNARAREVYDQVTRIQILDIYNNAGRGYSSIGTLADLVSLAAENRDSAMIERFANGFTTESGVRVPPLQTIIREMQEGSRGFSEVLLAHNQEFNYRGERSASRTQNVQGENATFVDRLNPASQLVALFTRDISAEEFGLEIGRLNTRTTQMRLDSRGVQSRYDAETRRLRTLAGSARNPALTLLYGREAEITSSERARARIETSRNALERARTLLQEAARYEVAAIRLSGREYEEAREECRRTTNREEQPIIIGILRARAADANARAHLLHQASLQLSNATYFIHRDVMISGEAHAGRFALNRSAENSEQVILEVTQSQGTRGQSFVRLQNSRLEIASADFVYGTNAVNRAIAIRNAVRIIDQNAQRIRRNIETVLSAITDSQGRIMRDRIVRRNANGTFTVVETNNELLDSRLLNEQLTRARRLAHSGNVNGAVGMLRETSTQLRIANIRAVVFRSHDGLLQRASRTEREAGRMEEFDIHSMIGVISGAEIDARERNFGSANETLEVFEQEVIPIAQARQNQLNAESSERDLERLHRTNAVNLRDAFRGTSLGLRARRDNALDEAAAQAEQDAQRALERAEQLRRSRLAIQRVEDIPVAETPNMILDALIEAGPQRGIGGIDRSYATHMRNLARASREGGNAVFEYLSQNPELLRRGLGILREQGNITQQAFDYMSAQSTHYQEHPESAHRMRRRNFAVRIAERQIEAMENIELLRRSGRIAPIEADAANGNISRLGEIGTFMIRADQRQFDQEMEGGAIAQRYTQITAEAIDVSESSIRGRGPALRTHELSLGLARRRTALDLPILGYEEVRNGGSNSYQRREFSAEQISQIERLNTINDRNIAQVTVVATTLTPQFSATNLTVTGAVSERNANEALDAIGRSSSIVQNAQSLIARRQTISERDRTQLDNYAEAARTQYYDSQEHVERGTRRERNFTRVASAAEVLGAGLLSASGLGTPVGIYFLSRSTFGFLDQARMAGGFDNLNEMQWAMGIGGIGLAGLGVMGSWTGGLFSELSGSGLASESFLLGLNRANLLLGRSMMAGGVVLGAGSMYEMYHSDPNANLFDYGLSFFMAAQPGLARGFAMAGEVNPSLIFGTSFRARAYRAAMTGFFGMGQHEMVQQYTARLYERVGALREALPEEVRRNVAIALAISGVHPSLEAQHEVLRFASEGGAQATRDPIELARAIRAFDNHAESSIDALGENAQTLIGGVEHALGRSLSAGEKLLLAEQLSAHPNMNPREMIIYLNDNRAATPTLEGFVQNHPEIARRQLPEETEFVQRPQQRRTREQPRDSLAGLRRASENRDLIIPESISTSEDIAHLARAVVREDPRAQRLIENLTQEQRRAVETLIRDPAFISLSGRNTREFNAFVRGNGLQVFGEEFAAFQSARPEVQHDQTIQPVTGEARTTRTREELVGRNENAQAAAEVGNNLRDETVAQNAQTLARELMFDNQGRRRGDRQLRSTLNSEAFAHRATELLGERAGQILNLLRRYENEPARIRTIGIGLMESNPIMRERYFEDLVSGLNQEGRVRIIRTPFSEQRRIEQNYTPEYAAELREAQVTRGFDAAENNLHGFGFNPQELRETHRREGFVGLGREMESRAHALEDTMTQAGQNANVSEIRQNLSFATAEHGPIDAQIQENLIRGYAFNGAEAVASRIRPEGEQRNALRAEIQEAFLRGGNFDSVLPILSREGVGAEQIAQLRDAFISGGTQSLRHSVQTARTEAVRTIETEGLRGFLQNRGIEYRMPPIDQTLSAEAATNGLRNFVDLVAQGNLEQTIRRIPGMENARITRVGYRHGLSGAYGVSVEIPGPTGPIERRVFVKTEDLAPAALGEELARNAGLLTAGHHVAEPFENGAIYANGEREQVNYGVMQDIHDLVGTWQRVSHPVREADGRIRMIEEEVFIESVALVADEIVDGEVTPRGQQAVNEYYDQMRTPEGREELFGGVYGYHRAAMEIGLGDRRAPNSGYAVGHTRDGRRVRTSSVAIDMDAVGMRIEPVIRNATHVRDQNGNIVHDLSVLHRDMGNATAEYLTGDYVETGIANYNNANPRNQIDVTSVEVAHSASRAIRNLEDVPAVSQEAQQRNAEVLERHNGQGFGLATPGRQLGVNSALSNQGELAQRPAPRADGRFTMRADEMQALHGELRSAESVQNHNRTERDAADFAVIYNGMFASEQLSASDARNFREVVATLYGSESSISWVGYGINDPTIEVEGTRINPLGYMIIRGRNISQQEMNRGFDTAVANGTFTPEQRAQYGEGYREYIRARLDIEVTAGRLSRENVDSFFRSADQLRGEVGLDIFDPNYVGRVSESLTRRTRTIPPESEVLEATPIITRMPTQAAPRRSEQAPVMERVEELGAALQVARREEATPPATRIAAATEANEIRREQTTSTATILLELPQGATNVEGRGRSPAAVLGNDITPTQVRVDLPDGSQYRFDGAVRVGEETYVRFTRKKGNETNSVYVRQVDPATTQAQQRVAHYREGITRAVEQIAQREAAAQTPEPTQLQQPTQGTSTQPRIITNEEIVGRVLDMTLAHHEEEERVQVRQMVETNDPEWDRVRRRAGMEITDDNSTVFRMLWNLAREVQLGTLTIERVREVYPDYAEAISRLGRYNSDQIGGQLAHEANLIVERRGGPQVIAMRELVRRATERGMSAELAASLYAPAVRYAQQHENNPHFQNLVRDEIFSSRFHGETISINARVIEVAADVVHRATEIQRAATRSGETEDLRIGGVFATRVARENGRERPNTEDCLRAAPISLAISREIVRETSWGIGYSRDARAFVEGAREIIQTAPIGRVEEAFDTYSSTVAYARRAQDGYEFFGNTPEQIARSNEAREDIYFIAARMAVANPEAARSILHGDGFGQVSFNIHSLFPRPQFAAESVNEATIAIAQIIRNTPEQDQAAAGNFIRMMLEDARRLPEGLRQIYIMATASNYHHSPELMGAVQTYDAQARDNGALVRATPGNDFAPRRIRRLPMLAEALGRNPEIAQGRENPFRNLDGKWARQAMPNDQTYAQITNMLINYSQVRATHQAAIEDGLLNEGVPADATRIQMRPRESLARIGDAAALGRAFGYEHQGYARRGGIDYAIFRENGSTREIMVQMVQEGAHQPGEVMTYYESVFRVANVERINRTTEETLAQLGTTRGREAEGVRSDFLGRRMRIINSVYEFAGAGTITHEQLREFVTQTTMHPERFNEASTQLFRALIPTVQLNETWIGQNVDLFLDFVSHRINLNRLAAGGAERVSGHTGTSPQYERAVQLLDRAIEAHANGRFAEFKFTPEFRAELEEVCAIAHIDVNRLWNTWTAEGQFNIQIGEGENRRTMRVLETGGFERSFRYGQVAGNEACQVIRNDHPVVGGVVGSIAQPWIRQIVIPIEGSNQSAFRQTLTMVINQDGRPVIIAQPAYGLRDMPAEQRSAIQAQVIDYLRTRYETIGVEVRLFQQENAQILPGSEMNPAYISAEARELPNGTRIEAGRPINHGFMTFRLRAPFVYMDSNSRSFPGGGRNGFYSGEIGERIMFPFRSAQ